MIANCCNHCCMQHRPTLHTHTCIASVCASVHATFTTYNHFYRTVKNYVYFQSHSSTIRTLIMHSMAEWYMRGDVHDQMRLSRILDVAQDLKVTPCCHRLRNVIEPSTVLALIKTYFTTDCPPFPLFSWPFCCCCLGGGGSLQRVIFFIYMMGKPDNVVMC